MEVQLLMVHYFVVFVHLQTIFYGDEERFLWTN